MATIGNVPSSQLGASLGNVQTFTASQRENFTTQTSLTHDLSVTNDFKTTPSAGGALTFSNIPASPAMQKGVILFVNGSNYAITAAATTKVTSTLLATISVTGTYKLAYCTDGTNVYVTASGALA